MTEAVFLDAAGTLIAPREPVGHTYARIFREAGLSCDDPGSRFARAFAEIDAPDYARWGRDAEWRWWREIVDFCARRVVPESVFEALFQHYASGRAWQLMPGVEPTLRKLSGSRRLAVVSNFDTRLLQILADLGVGEFFEAVVMSSEVGARKPDPAIFHAALEQLGLQPGRVVHIGDSPVADGEGAAAAGIRAVLLGRDIETFDALPDFLGVS